MTNPDNVTKEELIRVLDYLNENRAVEIRTYPHRGDTPGLKTQDIYQTGWDSEGLDTHDVSPEINDILNRLWE